MNRFGTIFLAMTILAAALHVGGCNDGDRSTSDPLITGKNISPTTQSSQAVGSLPMNLAISPDGRFIISTDMGYEEALWSIRVADGKGVSHVEFNNRGGAETPATRATGEASTEGSQAGSSVTNGLYYGLAISRDGTVYAAQGAHDSIAVLQINHDGKLTRSDSIKTQHEDFPAGLALDDAGHLYTSNNAAGDDDPYKLTGSVAIYDSRSKTELGRYTFKESHFGTSNFPLGIAVLHDGSRAFVAAERDDAVYALDTHDPAHPTLAAKIDVGAHPVAVLLNREQSRLFVANSLSDTISVIDPKTFKVIGTVLLRPRVARDLPGVTPTALTLSPDQKTLYAALGDMNAAAVIDANAMELRGYIPTGWYPSAIAATKDGRLLIANAKGMSVRNPNNRADPYDAKHKTATTLTILAGNVVSVKIPIGHALEKSTDLVLKNNRIDVLEHPKPNPLANIALGTGKIKHVVYIIKENRTYDQILGDMSQGNGDPSLVLFGKDITPNQHALADRFVLLDNLYACGEVSGDGWDWSTQGMADAYVTRNIPYNYSHRGRKFDEEGQNNGYPTAGAPAKDENGNYRWKIPPFHKDALPIPDVANTGRNIWDAAHDAKISLRNYGFFLDFAGNGAGPVGGPDNWPASPGLLPPGHDLDGVTDLDYRRFDLDYADSDAPDFYFKQTGDKSCLFTNKQYGKENSPGRFAEWNREFQMMLKKDSTGGAVPTLTLIRLPEDHTVGAKSGKHTPSSYVADNDYALGEIVQSVSQSAIWNNTAIFVIEDDAQSGVDHVDAHRTTAFVISPFIKAHSVDHHFHNTDSMLKTIELLLGLHPLSQYDAIADPIADWDDSPTNIEPFKAIMPSKNLIAAINPEASSLRRDDPRAELARRSDAMDFTHADAAPALELDQITWKTIRGVNSPMPTPRGMRGKDDDDD